MESVVGGLERKKCLKNECSFQEIMLGEGSG